MNVFGNYDLFFNSAFSLTTSEWPQAKKSSHKLHNKQLCLENYNMIKKICNINKNNDNDTNKWA